MFGRSSSASSTERRADFVVIGLGNPGAEYARTRHNVGTETVELLADKHNASLRLEKGTSSRMSTTSIGGERIVLAVSTTYMNDSGLAMSQLVKRYIPGDAARLIVVHDELDLPPGQVRVKVGGGTAGHNGLRSAQSHLHTLDFVRVRIGVGKPPSREAGRDHVLRRLSAQDQQVLGDGIARAADAVELIITEGADAAMSTVNQR